MVNGIVRLSVCGLLWLKTWDICCTDNQSNITSFQAHDLRAPLCTMAA